MARKLRFNDEVIVLGLEGRFKVLKNDGLIVSLFGPFPEFESGEPNFALRNTTGSASLEMVLSV